MRKKKRKFTLIEVLIAILIATGACLFLLQFENAFIKRSRQSLLVVQRERLTQEAIVQALELLYTNKIDWKAIQDKKPYNFSLNDPGWNVRCDFTPKMKEELIAPEVMDIEVMLTLSHEGDDLNTEQHTFRLCFKKEDQPRVQTPDA